MTGQAAVTGVIKTDMNAASAANDSGQQQPIRTKAQYDNWLQLQVMKKSSGGQGATGAAHMRSSSTGAGTTNTS